MSQKNYAGEQTGAYHMLIQDCLNVADSRDDIYVAIHRDDDCECVILVSLIQDQSLLSIIIADKIMFTEKNTDTMFEVANTLSAAVPMGWTALHVSEDAPVMLYRQCLHWHDQLDRETLIDILCRCIDKYKCGLPRSSGQGESLGNT